MIGFELPVEQPVFHRLGKQTHHAKRMSLWQIGIAENTQHTCKLLPGIKYRSGRADDASVELEEMFVPLYLDGSAGGNGGADSIGAALLFLPV